MDPRRSTLVRKATPRNAFDFLPRTPEGIKSVKRQNFHERKMQDRRDKPMEQKDFEIRREKGVTENPDGSLNFGKMDVVCKKFGAVH